MKRLLRKSTTYLIASVLAVVLLGVGIFTLNHQASATNQAGRLITIHDRGEEILILSDGATVAEALEDAGVTVDAKDAVEPALAEQLVASEYQVNIYRARPVTVIDGATRQKIVTPYQTPERIAKDAGITLYDEDGARISRSDDLVADGAGLQLNIERAVPFSFDLYGATTKTRTLGKTVGDMLAEKGIQLESNDRVRPSLKTPIKKDMKIRVWREGKQTVTIQEKVPFDVQQIQDADQEIGYKKIKSKGSNGERHVTYEIVVKKGKEISRKEIASITVKKAVKQVEVIGVKSKALPYTGGGNKTEWLEASNIPRSAWGYADFMVARESGWNPNAVNASSGACGLAQALPCSKVPGNPYNPIDSLNWMNGYVNGRYGGWENAYNFWNANHYY